MEKIAKVVQQIKETSSRTRKESILEKNKDLPGFKEVMHFIYNPYQRTGISDKKMDAHRVAGTSPITLSAFLKFFSEHQTGTIDDVILAWGFVNSQTSKAANELAYAMATKNLKIGVTEKTLNKIYGDTFIPVIGCELGVEYAKTKSKMSGIYISSRKIDGIRRLLVKEAGVISMYSRSGMPDDGLVDIIREAANLPDNMVYDGELEAIGEFSDNIALRQATNSIANRKGDRTGLTYNVFDAVPIEDFKLGQSKHVALVRKRFVDVLFGVTPMPDVQSLAPMEFIKAVPIECISDDLALHEKVFFRMVANGEEGLMLIKADSLYKVGKRTNDWVKMKNYVAISLPVIGVYEGTGKYTGMLGGVYVDYCGNSVGTGSGFDDAERKKYWDNPELIVGKNIKIVCQGESSDSTTGLVSLNCAIYKGITDAATTEFVKLMEDEA